MRSRVNVEPGGDAAPRFRIVIDEVKRRELDGFSGIIAKVLGQFFDELVTQLANGRASRLSEELNAEIVRRVALFKEYGVFYGIEYSPGELVLHFDLTRLRSEGIAGYVFTKPQPGSVPLYRWLHPGDHSHYYTLRPGDPDRPRRSSRVSPATCWTIANPTPSRSIAGRTHATTCIPPRPTASTSAASGIGPEGSPATSTTIPSRELSLSTASSTRAVASISTRRMPSPSS